MRVEADDPTGDWTREGVFEVAPGVYRIPLPLPHDSLRAVNVYALVTDDELVLVDSGWSITVARETMDKALAALGRHVGDIRRFLVTHIHRDHFGLAAVLKNELGTRVEIGTGEADTLALLQGLHPEGVVDHFQALARAGAAQIVKVFAAMDNGPRPEEWPSPDGWLRTGDRLAVAGRTLDVVETPGHTRGHVVFVDEGLLFAGDHVLPHITPSIGLEAAQSPSPLGDYLASLRLVRAMPDRTLLPAHGSVGPSVHKRVDELIEHHAQRLDVMAAAVDPATKTALEVAQIIGWTRRNRSFADLDIFNQMLAVTETAAHLELLVAQGRLGFEDTDGVRHYRPL